MTTIHVYPVRDLVEHDTDTDDCPCGPTVEPVECGGGGFNFVATHHSLDGREFTERDYAGPAMPRETL